MKIKVGLLVGEFFSNSLPFCNGKGGYGMLARKYITEYIPNDEIEIDTIIGFNDTNKLLKYTVDEKKTLLFLPKFSRNFFSRIYRKLFNRDFVLSGILDQYDIFISIEFQSIAQTILRFCGKKKKLILWIQDPRTKGDWKELDSMSLFKQSGYREDPKTNELLNKLYSQKKLIGISQGKYLVEKAKELYKLPVEFDVAFLPNPVEIPTVSDLEIKNKKNKIVALGRLDSVKRPWIIGEIAKKCPHYDFYFLGQYHEENVKEIMKPYHNLSNCFFMGHIEGKEKESFLREAKFLINTSIHEAIPISFLEALSYGILLISNRNPDDLTSKFGFYTGQINGDAPLADIFVTGINNLDADNNKRSALARQAVDYINTYHNLNKFITDLRHQILSAVAQ